MTSLQTTKIRRRLDVSPVSSDTSTTQTFVSKHPNYGSSFVELVIQFLTLSVLSDFNGSVICPPTSENNLPPEPIHRMLMASQCSLRYDRLPLYPASAESAVVAEIKQLVRFTRPSMSLKGKHVFKQLCRQLTVPLHLNLGMASTEVISETKRQKAQIILYQPTLFVHAERQRHRFLTSSTNTTSTLDQSTPLNLEDMSLSDPPSSSSSSSQTDRSLFPQPTSTLSWSSCSCRPVNQALSCLDQDMTSSTFVSTFLQWRRDRMTVS